MNGTVASETIKVFKEFSVFVISIAYAFIDQGSQSGIGLAQPSSVCDPVCYIREFILISQVVVMEQIVAQYL